MEYYGTIKKKASLTGRMFMTYDYIFLRAQQTVVSYMLHEGKKEKTERGGEKEEREQKKRQKV